MQKITLGLLLAVAAMGQTQVDLRTQSKSVDFSSANATKPVKTGFTVPATCFAGEIFFNLTSIPGQNLYLCVATNTWTNLTSSTGSGGGTGGGSTPTSTSALTDLVVTQTAANILTIGANCSLTSPCNIRFGSRTFTIIASATATVPSGANNSGVVFIYVTPQNTQAIVSAGNTMGVVCNAGCTAVDGVNQFPPDSIPLFSWSATAGVWDINGGVDIRAFLSSKSIIGGVGIITADLVGQTIVSADTAVVAVRVSVPGTAGATCKQGNYAADASFFYQCIATDTWRRTAISAW